MVEIVFVIPFHLVFAAIDGAGDDGIECSGVGPEIVLDDGLAGLVFVFAAFLVSPPEVGGFGSALFALDAATSGIVEELNCGALVHFDLEDAVVEVVVVFVAVGVFGHVTTGIIRRAAGGELVIAVVGAVFGLACEGGARPVAVVVIVPGLVRGRDATAAGVGGDAVAGVVLCGKAGGCKDTAIGEGFPGDLFVDAVAIGHRECSDGGVIFLDGIGAAEVVKTVVGYDAGEAVAKSLLGEAVGVVVELGEDVFGFVGGAGDEVALVIVPGLRFSIGKGVGVGTVGVIVGAGEGVGAVAEGEGFFPRMSSFEWRFSGR